MLLGLLAFAPAGQAREEASRFHPRDPDYLVLELSADQDVPRERAVRDAAAANRIAARYIDLARFTREQRYFGRAEAILEPWINKTDATAETLRLQADILQNRHDFPSALALLDRAATLDPRDSQAHLMRATILMVRGEFSRARTDCAALISNGVASLGTVCLAQSLAAVGRLEQASEMIELLLERGELPELGARAWAETSLADFASRRGELRLAERHLRIALREVPQSEFVRSALSDVLMARGAPEKALALLDMPRPSVGILVRRVLGQTMLNDAESRRTSLGELDELLRLEAQRGERVHLREETLLALGLRHPAARALELAKANFSVQREPIDARLLARAAADARDQATLEELRDWCHRTGFKDRLVDEILSRFNT